MASTKSAATLDRETSQAINKRATLADMRALLAQRDATIAELRAENSRKELWINRYAAQLKQARRTAPERLVSDRRAAMEAACAEAMRTGQTVKV